MRYSDAIHRLTPDGPDNWAVYQRAKERIADGHDVIEMAIGEPDVPPPTDLTNAAIDAIHAGRTNYASGRGEIALRTALADRYSRRTGRTIGAEQVLCFPGTQTALYAAIRAVAGDGDEILIGDPMYATYEPVARAAGATVTPVPLRPERGFRIDAHDLADRVTSDTTAMLLNTPHNPTGAVLDRADIEAIGAVADRHDLWIVVDEVYEELVYDGRSFASPFDDPAIADRVIVLNSISKSHAAPGFRSGWCVASADFCNRSLPLSEAMLFGNQPFIADATALAVAAPSPVAAGMCERFAARARRLQARLHGETSLIVHAPGAGMFALVDVSSTGMDGATFANALLDEANVAVMPGSSFGTSIENWIRVALTRPDDQFDEGTRRLVEFVTDR